MQRSELVKALELVQPALAKKDYIPVFTHYVFDGERVTGYNDQIAISVDCTLELEGCLPGHLLSLLKSTPENEVELSYDPDGNYVFTCGSSKFTLPCLPLEDAVYKRPKSGKKKLELEQNWLKGLGLCLISVDPSNFSPERYCVNYFVASGQLYGTDGVTISHFDLETTSELEEICYLPEDFCKAVLSIARAFEKEGLILYLTRDGVVADFGEAHVFCKYVGADKPLDFNAAIERALGGQESLESLPLTEEILAAFNRAQLLLSAETGLSQGTIIKVAGAELYLKSVNNLGKVEDRITTDGDYNETNVKVSPKLLNRSAQVCSHICFAENCVVMHNNDNFHYYIATMAL